MIWAWVTGQFDRTRESFLIQTIDTPSIQSEISKLPAKNVVYQSSLRNPGLVEDTKYLNMPVSAWCIKGAYNAPRSGNYVSVEAIEYVLDKGCRWLDIETYYVAEPNMDGSPMYELYCGGSPTQADTTPTTYNESYVLLSSVIHRAIEYGFQNTSDPLFLSIRFRINRSDFGGAARNLAEILQGCADKFSEHSHDSRVYPTTRIGDIADKVIFVVDSSVADYSVVGDYSQVSIPGDGWTTTYESRLHAMLNANTAPIDPNPNTITVMYPDATDTHKNIPSLDAIRKFGFQVPLIKYYVGEETEVDDLFDSHQMGMVPISFFMQ
jgi:hypothetical protein